jgi:hypothetical protein
MILLPQVLRIDRVSDFLKAGWNRLPWNEGIENIAGEVREVSEKALSYIGRGVLNVWNAVPGTGMVSDLTDRINPFDTNQQPDTGGNTTGGGESDAGGNTTGGGESDAGGNTTGGGESDASAPVAPDETVPPIIPDNTGNTVEIPSDTDTGGGTPPVETPDVTETTPVPDPDILPTDTATPEVPVVVEYPPLKLGIDPMTGDLYRSDIKMPVLDGHGFAFDAEAAGLVPKGMGDELTAHLQSKGLDDGAHIPGFKNGGMWHTETGYSPWSNEAALALAEFNDYIGFTPTVPGSRLPITS